MLSLFNAQDMLMRPAKFALIETLTTQNPSCRGRISAVRSLSLLLSTIWVFLLIGVADVSPASDSTQAATIESLSQLNPASPQIPDRTFNVKDFGAVGDGKTW